MGLGGDNVVKVKTDQAGAMLTSDLKEQISKSKRGGKTPLAVIATMGTTVLGAFDNLEETAAVISNSNSPPFVLPFKMRRIFGRFARRRASGSTVMQLLVGRLYFQKNLNQNGSRGLNGKVVCLWSRTKVFKF